MKGGVDCPVEKASEVDATFSSQKKKKKAAGYLLLDWDAENLTDYM